MKWRAYPKYQDSGIECLGEIPEHWTTDRLKWTVTDCRNGVWGTEPDGVHDIVCVRVADFDRVRFKILIDEPTMRAVFPNKRRGRTLEKGDLLLEKSGGGDLQPVGAVMLYDHDVEAVCSNFIARMAIAPDWNSRFLVYLHAHLYAGRVNTKSIKQTTGIQNIDSMAYLNEMVVYPTPPEQRAIAVFLDRKTAHIDALIAKKERQIELLQEKRAALISHAVTKGLDPSVPMKDSGIEWLGEIPTHWEMKRLKFIAAVQSGVAKGRNLEGRETIDLPYLRVANVQRGYVNLSDVATITIGKDEVDRYALRKGDILMTEGGDYDKLGRGAVWEGQITPCIHQNHIFAVRAHRGRNPYWISAITQADYARHYFILHSKQSTNLALYIINQHYGIVCSSPAI